MTTHITSPAEHQLVFQAFMEGLTAKRGTLHTDGSSLYWRDHLIAYCQDGISLDVFLPGTLNIRRTRDLLNSFLDFILGANRHPEFHRGEYHHTYLGCTEAVWSEKHQSYHANFTITTQTMERLISNVVNDNVHLVCSDGLTEKDIAALFE